MVLGKLLHAPSFDYKSCRSNVRFGEVVESFVDHEKLNQVLLVKEVEGVNVDVEIRDGHEHVVADLVHEHEYAASAIQVLVNQRLAAKMEAFLE